MPTSTSTPQRGRRLARSERRAQILDVAARSFAGRETSAVTYEEIAEAAGISRSLLYNYFPDRAALLDEIAMLNSRSLRAEVNDALSRVPGRVDALAEAVRVHLRFAGRDIDAYASATGEQLGTGPNPAETVLVSDVASMFGNGDEAQLVAGGLVHALRAMVMSWANDGRVDSERADQLITAVFAGAISRLDDLGLSFQPTWPIPRTVGRGTPQGG